MKRILIIGGTGYIGSRLTPYLKSRQETPPNAKWPSWSDPPLEPKYDIDTIDLNWFNVASKESLNFCIDYNLLTPEWLARYNAVILLAGYSSPAISMNSGFVSTYANNVMNFVNLLNKLGHGRKFIYMSSASVYNNVPGFATEDSPLLPPKNVYDLSKQEIDKIAPFFNIEYYGLRLATVNGYSANFRSDIMINSMCTEAKMLGRVIAFNASIRKGILSLTEDLCRAIETIIDSTEDKRGIYNLASFHGTVGSIAQKISEVADVTLITKEDERTSLTYDFQMDCSKFCKAFNFEFKGTVESVANEILSNFNYIQNFAKRVDGIKYV